MTRQVHCSMSGDTWDRTFTVKCDVNGELQMSGRRLGPPGDIASQWCLNWTRMGLSGNGSEGAVLKADHTQ